MQIVLVSLKWRCRFSVENTQTIFFTRKKIDDGIRLRLYGSQIERDTVRFLWMLFDARVTWAEHINRIIGKSKRTLNIMRCL